MCNADEVRDNGSKPNNKMFHTNQAAKFNMSKQLVLIIYLLRQWMKMIILSKYKLKVNLMYSTQSLSSYKLYDPLE